MTRSPHYLRVVQALALVSGFGPVAVNCSSTGRPAVFTNDGGETYDAPITGGVGAGPVQCPETDPNCNLCGLCADAGAGTDADAADVSADTGIDADATVEDASLDATVGGGPRPPPDLPA